MNKKTNYIAICFLLLGLTIGTVFTDYAKQLGALLADANVQSHPLSEIEGSENLATKTYVNDAISGIGIGGYVPTSRTISPGSGLLGGGDLTANRTLTVDSTVVRTTGDQTLAGTKTFSGNVSFSNNIVVPATPTANTHAASKGYVDGKSGGFSTCQTVSGTGTVTCPSGWTLTGGGGDCTPSYGNQCGGCGAEYQIIHRYLSQPTITGNGWLSQCQVYCFAQSTCHGWGWSTLADGSVYAICCQ